MRTLIWCRGSERPAPGPTLEHWLLTVGDLPPLGILGNVWRHFWLSQLAERVCATEARGANHPTVLRTAPKQSSLAQHVSSAEIEKLWYMV